MDQSDIQKHIEAILFYKNEPVLVSELSSMLDVTPVQIEEVLEDLEEVLSSRGIVLVRNRDELTLTTAPSVSTIIEKITKEELNKELSPASLETLSVIAYKGPVSRKEIEYIRGVNCSMSLRTLLLRGLIEKQSSKLDERIYLYTITMDTLSYLGIQSLSELPEYDRIRKELEVPKEEPTETQ